MRMVTGEQSLTKSIKCIRTSSWNNIKKSPNLLAVGHSDLKESNFGSQCLHCLSEITGYQYVCIDLNDLIYFITSACNRRLIQVVLMCAFFLSLDSYKNSNVISCEVLIDTLLSWL